jgi:hypothetical protein
MNMRIQELKRTIRSWRRRGQSLVEFAILLPVLLVMLSGLIEFGFILNDYLDLIDAAREVARFAADEDPIRDQAGNFNPNPTTMPEPAGFYDRVWLNTDRALQMGGQIALDPTSDDVVVSLFSVNFGAVTQRYPGVFGTNGGENGWRRWENRVSEFAFADVQQIVTDSIATNGNIPPNTGVVLVEVFFDYHMLMALPWITAFVPDPVTLHAYAIMPNAALEPTPTP